VTTAPTQDMQASVLLVTQHLQELRGRGPYRSGADVLSNDWVARLQGGGCTPKHFVKGWLVLAVVVCLCSCSAGGLLTLAQGMARLCSSSAAAAYILGAETLCYSCRLPATTHCSSCHTRRCSMVSQGVTCPPCLAQAELQALGSDLVVLQGRWDQLPSAASALGAQQIIAQQEVDFR
jgi:hypothetical protein